MNYFHLEVQEIDILLKTLTNANTNTVMTAMAVFCKGKLKKNDGPNIAHLCPIVLGSGWLY